LAGLGIAACGSTQHGDLPGTAGGFVQPDGAVAGTASGGSGGAPAGSAGSAGLPIQLVVGGAADIPADPSTQPLPEPHAAKPCDNPQPYVAGGGYLVCDDHSLRIGERSACPTTLPREAPTEPLFFEECALDVDCTASAHGFCAYGQCKYGCVSDDECGENELCFCGADVGACVHADCRSDADCPADYPCTGNLPFGTDVAGFLCQTPIDTCQSDYDCPGPRMHCWTDENGARACIRDPVG
jgi:hypothetical protein